jgi:hypothetical protein
MSDSRRACRLCGKQVSSISGLTRHTEICQRKRKTCREAKNIDRIQTLSQTIQAKPEHTKSSTLGEGHDSGDTGWGNAEYDTGLFNWQDEELLAGTATSK